MTAPQSTEIAREQARRSLMRFIPWATEGYKRPEHLAPFIDRLERAFRGEFTRLVVHAPPQHGKTESILHSIGWGLWNTPVVPVSFSSYGSEITRKKSSQARDIAAPLVPLKSISSANWTTDTRHGGLIARSIVEGLTGHPVKLAFIDDVVKDRLQAESAKYRTRAIDWLQASVLTRLPPNSSVIVSGTRWHPEDLSGYCINKLGWEYMCLPAVNADGSVLWPERWNPETMAQRRAEVGEYVWSSLYQGAPRPRGGTVFGDPHGYDVAPVERRQVAGGIDLSYTAKSSADYSVLVVMLRVGDFFYVLDVVREQKRAPDFAKQIKPLLSRFATLRLRWYAATSELGAGQFMAEALARPMETLIAKGDKFTRAIPYAAAWNAGRVLVPQDSETHPWVNQFLAEHATFTGVEDAHDDQVDAAAAAFDLLNVGHISVMPLEEAPANVAEL